MRTTPVASLTAILLAAACSATPVDVAIDQPPAEAADSAPALSAEGGFIESVSYVGTGCPAGTATTALSLDKQAATSVFSNFIASASPGSDPATANRNCLTMMHINVPAGWSYALSAADYRGFASLEKGVTASIQSVYVISGSAAHVVAGGHFAGEMGEDYGQHDIGADAPGPSSPCGGGQDLWIATRTDLHGEGAAQFTVDTLDTELQWRRCD